MTVSRKSTDEEADEPASVIEKGEIYQLSEDCYQESKAALQKRSGYDEYPPEVLEQKAVDEKLPSGSQSY